MTPPGARRYTMSAVNPNCQIGGGGCVCSPLKNEDQAGPFAVFPASETDNNLSPHVVVCAPCAKGIIEQAGDEMGQSGENDYVPAEEITL